MAKNTEQAFESIRIVGGLLSTKVLQDSRLYKLPGQGKSDYKIEPGLSFNEEIGRYWRIAQGRWKEYQQQIAREDINSNTLAQQEWLIPLFNKVLGYDVVKSDIKVIGEREFPITHTSHNDAITMVLCGADYDLDKGHSQFGQEGRKRSPVGLAQEYLNAENTSLWAIVSNGTQLRLLRDNPAMTRPAYIEVDFTRLFDEDNYADFATLWLLLHATRIAPQNSQVVQCWLEQWRDKGQDDGERALDNLREGVEVALRQLGQGFLSHKDNTQLRELIANEEVTTNEYFQQILKLVYRFLFLLTAEDRNLLLYPEKANEKDFREARKLYLKGYSISCLRDRAKQKRFYDQHADAWQQLLVNFEGFANGQELLAQPALGGLFNSEQCALLETSAISNKHLYEAIYNLSYFTMSGVQSRINYRDMDTEEFGSVYESLLELTPRINPVGTWSFGFMGDEEGEEAGAGHSRKLTGSYYTPDSLVQELIKSALEPVIKDRLQENPQQPRKAILSIKVCDPACGSGHFLLSASRRLATELAAIDAGVDQPTEVHYQHAMRDVVKNCIYGVDLNPLAVELCKTGLWLESLEPGKPLSFMDSHIQNGNALLGISSPEQLTYGIPNAAFKALSGDDKQLCKKLSKINSDHRKSFSKEKDNKNLSLALENSDTLNELVALEQLPEDSVEQIEKKNSAYKSLRDKASSSRLKQAADLFLGSFLATKDHAADIDKIPNSQNLYLCLYTDQEPEELSSAFQLQRLEEAKRLCQENKVFHWPIAFAHIFARENAGFDCVLGNPPWERIKLQEEEFFSTRSTDITDAKNKSERSQRIQWLSEGMLAKHLYLEIEHTEEVSKREKELFNEFIKEKHSSEALSSFVHIKEKDGGRYPLTGVGDVNTYALFSETILKAIESSGRAGFIVPSGIATDKSTKDYFGYLMTSSCLSSFYEFENEGFFKGAGQGHMLRFALTTITGSELASDAAKFMFQGKRVEDLHDKERVFNLSLNDIALVNPNTLTCPIFQSNMDAELTNQIYLKHSILIKRNKNNDIIENSWGIRFKTLFHMSNDSHLFKTYEQLVNEGFEQNKSSFVLDGQYYYPLYESKMIHIYNHRYTSFADSEHQRAHILPKVDEKKLAAPDYFSSPYYWVSKDDYKSKFDSDESALWWFGWRNVTDSRASARTLITSIIPGTAAGNSLPLYKPNRDISAAHQAALLGNMSSIVLDYCARMKVGGLNFNFFIFEQLPVIKPDYYNDSDIAFIAERVGQLTYVCDDLEDWGKALGFDRPFVYNEEKRSVLQAELDAYFAKLYGLSREQLQFILSPESLKPGYPSQTFSVLERNEKTEFGEYRTQRLILDSWDKIESGELH